MFAVSSQDAFGTVGFLCTRINETQKIELAFVFGKARVVPIRVCPFRSWNFRQLCWHLG